MSTVGIWRASKNDIAARMDSVRVNLRARIPSNRIYCALGTLIPDRSIGKHTSANQDEGRHHPRMRNKKGWPSVWDNLKGSGNHPCYRACDRSDPIRDGTSLSSLSTLGLLCVERKFVALITVKSGHRLSRAQPVLIFMLLALR